MVLRVNSQRVSVVGEVNRNGLVDIGTDTRVVEAISYAGGFTAFANKKRVRIIRKTENGEVEMRFDYDRYVAGKAPGTNVRLQPGDVIVVPD
jgi:polysaccharide export outer membrane protein